MLLLDLRDSHHVDGAGIADAAAIDRRTGCNSGNFAFRYALVQRFFPGAELARFDALNNLHDPNGCVVLACANWIGLSPEHDSANADRWGSLSSANVRVVPFGLGCQIPLGTGFDALGEATKGFLLRLCEMAPSMSVRDEQTADLLRSIGYTAAEVTGCPSNFINADPALGRKMAERAQLLLDNGSGWSRLAVHMTEYSGGYSYSSDVFMRQFMLMRDHGASYAVQDLPLLPFLTREMPDLPPEYESKLFPDLGCDDDAISLVLRRHATYFASYDQWLLSARKFDLGFGMRLHGNMATIQAGVPSIVVTHDARTEQLCRTMGLPNVDVQTFLRFDVSHPGPLLDVMVRKLPRYDACRSLLAERMQRHLVRSGLPVAPVVSCLADIPDLGALAP
jgi:hypothetical protein